TATAPVLTELATSVGLNLGDGNLITSFAATSLSVSYLVYKAFISNLYISIPILVVVIAAVWIYMEKGKGRKNEASN
ncbi:MAG: PTS galactitol transporter subunit IIC, partial [Clostridium sp.]|nr:PTS galactitol transporter subunit IIC [Clostridium sp.]